MLMREIEDNTNRQMHEQLFIYFQNKELCFWDLKKSNFKNEK